MLHAAYTGRVGFALWIDESGRVAWARGTHEYRPLGTAVLAISDQFRVKDFRPSLRVPADLNSCFAGFFGSLETVNEFLPKASKRKLRRTPPHLLV